jgi:hypothetical protein
MIVFPLVTANKCFYDADYEQEKADQELKEQEESEELSGQEDKKESIVQSGQKDTPAGEADRSSNPGTFTFDNSNSELGCSVWQA